MARDCRSRPNQDQKQFQPKRRNEFEEQQSPLSDMENNDEQEIVVTLNKDDSSFY